MRPRTGGGVPLTAEDTGEGADAAAAAARRVVEAVLRAGDTSGADMRQATATLHALADQLEGHAPPVSDRLVEMWAGEGVTSYDPVTGPRNPLAPPLTLRGVEDGSIEAVTTLGMAYQGPPGCVHGGVSALLLDHTLGVANHWAGLSGVTAELTVRYHRPVPLFEPLTVSGRQVSVDGRKIRTEGTLSAGGTVRVSVQGLFVAKQPPRPR